MSAVRGIPGVSRPAATDLPVLKPFDVRAHSPDAFMLTRWVASVPPSVPVALFGLALLWPAIAHAQDGFGMDDAMEALWRWMPFLITSGFFFNVLISVMSMAIGTAAGRCWDWPRSRSTGRSGRWRGSSPSSSATRPGW